MAAVLRVELIGLKPDDLALLRQESNVEGFVRLALLQCLEQRWYVHAFQGRRDACAPRSYAGTRRYQKRGYSRAIRFYGPEGAVQLKRLRHYARKLGFESFPAFVHAVTCYALDAKEQRYEA